MFGTGREDPRLSGAFQHHRDYGSLPENVNYGVKSSFLTALLESLPAANAKLAEPGTKDRPQEEIARMVQAATVLVVVE